jgi:hypothetical protein
MKRRYARKGAVMMTRLIAVAILLVACGLVGACAYRPVPGAENSTTYNPIAGAGEQT